jgi:hypothetical protein
MAAREVLEGWTFMRARPEIGRMAFAKAAWAVAGGALVYMLTLIGESIDPARPAFAIGVLFSARGLGTGIGPILARARAKDRLQWPWLMGACILLSGLSYLVVAAVGFTYWIGAVVLMAHAASGANWVLSTILLQERTEDRMRGRVFATEWLLLMGMEALSILAASLVLELRLLDLKEAVLAFGILQVLVGALWLILVVPRERKGAESASGTPGV